MKRIIAALTAVLLCAGCALAEMPDVIAYTCYQQLGWGDRFEAGCIDSRGNVYAAKLESGGLDLPGPDSAACAHLFEKGLFEKVGEYGGDLAALRSLTAAIAPVEAQYAPAANDAGTETSYAVNGDTWVPVGASGDDLYENTDPAAQAVYRILRDTFRGRVTSYYGEPLIAPKGFEPLPLLTFIGFPDADIENAEVSAVFVDCEAGNLPYEMTDDRIARAKAIARGTVIGKHSNSLTSGNTVIYTFTGADGETIARFEIFDDLLTTDDGMYDIAY